MSDKARIKLTKAREYLLKGYLDLLDRAPPNGRYTHWKAQKIVALRLSLAVGVDLSSEWEEDLKELIRVLYPVPNLDDLPFH